MCVYILTWACTDIQYMPLYAHKYIVYVCGVHQTLQTSIYTCSTFAGTCRQTTPSVGLAQAYMHQTVWIHASWYYICTIIPCIVTHGVLCYACTYMEICIIIILHISATSLHTLESAVHRIHTDRHTYTFKCTYIHVHTYISHNINSAAHDATNCYKDGYNTRPCTS